MNEALRRELIAMRDEDLRMREDLLRRGVLGDGYHPEMEAVHGRNAARLRQLIGEHGWPGKTLVGEDGAEAAWLILQHAIGEPDFQRSGLKALKAAAEAGEVPRWQVAYLEDRVRFFEGRPQLYATQFDLGDDGGHVLYETEDIEHVDERRAAVGLPPYQPPSGDPVEGRKTREQMKEFREGYEEWLRRTGWRK